MTPREKLDAIVAHIQRQHKLPDEALTTVSGPSAHIAFRKHVFTALHEAGMTFGAIARKYGLKPGTVRAAVRPYYQPKRDRK